MARKAKSNVNNHAGREQSPLHYRLFAVKVLTFRTLRQSMPYYCIKTLTVEGTRDRKGPKTPKAVENKCCNAKEKVVVPRTLTALLGGTSYISMSTQLEP
jgi:hypothetical protein